MDFLSVSRSLTVECLGTACFLAAVAGFLSHVLYFIRGYRVPQTAWIVAFYLSAGVILSVVAIYQNGLLNGLIVLSAVSTSYFVTLFSSIIIYRLFFHPLRNFPGPLPAKVSKLYNVVIAQHMHEHQNDWVRKYGDIVRIAPNELLIVSLDGQQKIHGAQAKTTKGGTFYDFIQYHGVPNLDSIANRDEHRWRRQVWDRALNTKALEQYEAYGREICHTWLGKLASLGDKPINTSLYSLLIPFDNMGKMGYSVDFGAVRAGKEVRMLSLIETSFRAIGQVGQLTWPIAIAKDLKLSPEQTEFENLACRLTDEREKDDTEDKEDIMKYILADYRAEKPAAFFNRNIMYADSQAIMIGGTDTIAAALSYCFYYLAKDSSLRDRLRQEVGQVFGKTIPGEFTQSDLGNLDLLNAVIDETMRLQNAVCNNGVRSTPPEGITVDGRYIPGNVSVYVGVHAMHRSPKYFKQPDEFIPERWTTCPDLVIDKRAFHPFLIGPFNCVGKRLAMTVLRLVLAYTTWHYDFQFAPGEDGTKIFTESRNQLILKAGPLHCIFKKRQDND